MVEEIDLEKCNFLNFRSPVTLTLTLDRINTAYHRASPIDFYLHTKFHWNWKNFLWMDIRMYRRTYGRTFPPLMLLAGLTRSRPNNTKWHKKLASLGGLVRHSAWKWIGPILTTPGPCMEPKFRESFKAAGNAKLSSHNITTQVSETTRDYWLRELRFLRLTRHKISHVGDMIPSQSLGSVLKKLNLTQQSKQHRNKIANN